MSGKFTRLREKFPSAARYCNKDLQIGMAEFAFQRGFLDSFHAPWASLHIVVAHILLAGIWDAVICLLSFLASQEQKQPARHDGPYS